MNMLDLLQNIVLAISVLILVIQYAGIFLIRYAKKYRWAVFFYTCLIKPAPISSSNYINRSWAYLKLKEYELGIRDCSKALALNPATSMAYNNRGFAYLKLEQYQKALQDLDCAIELKPDFSTAYENRRALYLRTHEYQYALQDADRDIELTPDNPGPYRGRGIVYLHLKEYQSALQDFDHALTLEPTFSNAYHDRGYTYLHLGNIEQGRENLLKALQLNPTYLAHSWMIEFCNMCVEKPDQVAADRLEKLAEHDITSDTAYLAYICRGVALWLRERYEDALIELEQSLLLESNNEDAYFWIGITYASLERTEEAKQALEHSLELGLPRVLLAPLRLLPEKNHVFFEKYIN